MGTATCILQQTALMSCGPQNTVVVSVDQNGVPGLGDSSHPTVNGATIGFTSVAGLLPNVSGQQVYAANPCLFSSGSCTLTLVSADANGNPVGGDFAAMETSGMFATFSTTGSSLSPETSEVFLAAPFF